MGIDQPLFRTVEEEESRAGPAAEPWLVLVVDDDRQVHAMTAVLLRDFEFEGRPFEVVSAFSATEAKALLAERPGIPVCLLDVVMETDDAGLKLVRYIREDLGNTRLRIILRTGQPGQAPEREVVVAYDINDYKSKSELTSQKLFTTLVGSLRAWRDIVAVERHRQGLQRILDASASLLETRSLRVLVDGLVEQLGRVVEHRGGAILACRDSHRAGDPRPTIIGGSGRFADRIGRPVAECLSPDVEWLIAEAFATLRSTFARNRCVLVFQTLEHGTTVFLMERPEPYTADEHRLLEIFCGHIAFGFDNVCLYEDLLALNQSLERRVAERTAELVASQKSLAAAKERAETALERELSAKHQQRQFLGMVSHEFRTPLAVIDSAAQMLALRAEKAGVDVVNRVEVIRSSVQRLNGLIEVHLTDERLQSGNLVLERTDADLAHLIRSSVDAFRVAWPGHTFVVDVEALPPSMSGDEHLLGLVFTNLINNAIKFSDADPYVEIRSFSDGSTIVVEVRDRGCGIAENELPRIFDRFFRGSNAAGIPGTGIGLHTVQQIVHLHGGAISVDSAPGAGSSFRVVLPSRAEAA